MNLIISLLITSAFASAAQPTCQPNLIRDIQSLATHNNHIAIKILQEVSTSEQTDYIYTVSQLRPGSNGAIQKLTALASYQFIKGECRLVGVHPLEQSVQFTGKVVSVQGTQLARSAPEDRSAPTAFVARTAPADIREPSAHL